MIAAQDSELLSCPELFLLCPRREEGRAPDFFWFRMKTWKCIKEWFGEERRLESNWRSRLFLNLGGKVYFLEQFQELNSIILSTCFSPLSHLASPWRKNGSKASVGQCSHPRFRISVLDPCFKRERDCEKKLRTVRSSDYIKYSFITLQQTWLTIMLIFLLLVYQIFAHPSPPKSWRPTMIVLISLVVFPIFSPSVVRVQDFYSPLSVRWD